MSDFRALMKAKAGGGLTGKDKAKYLRSLKEEKADKQVAVKPIIIKEQSGPAISSSEPSTATASVKQVRVISIPSLSTAPSKASVSNVPPVALTVKDAKPAPSIPLGGLVGYDDEVEETVPASNFIKSDSGPPPGFFDEQPPPNFFDEQPKVSHSNAADEYTEHLVAEAAANSLIPKGFFDDPLADLKARGVDIRKIEKKQEKREEEELKSFLGAIEVIQDDGSAVEKELVEEEKEREIEEEMMQLNYERRVAVLLHQSDRVISAQLKRKAQRTEEEEEDEESGRGVEKKLKSLNSSDAGSSSSSSSSGSSSSSSSGGNVITTAEMINMMAAASKEGEAIFSSLLGPTPSDSVSSSSQSTSAPLDKDGPSGGERGGGVAGAGGTGVRSLATDAHLDVAQIFKKKKADSKKLLAQALASEYNPLDFMDWTARSL